MHLYLFSICLFIYVLYLSILFYMSSLNGWKVWILKEPYFGATNFLSNFIFLSYLLVYPEIVMCLAYTSKKCEFLHPHLRGTPSVVLSNFVKFNLFIFAILKNFISPGWVVKFWILAFFLRGIPSFWYSQILSNFILSSFCLSWKFHLSSVNV